MVKRKKSLLKKEINKTDLFNELMLRKSFRESTPTSREIKFRRALRRRMKN